MAHLSIRYGAEKQLLDYLYQAKEEPNEIRHYVCALRISDQMAEELRGMDVPYIVTRLWPWDVGRFSRFVKEHNIHILHIHNQLRFPFRSRILTRLAGVPLIIEHEHGMVWNTFSTRLIRWTQSLVDVNICNSEAAKIMLKEKCGIDAKVILNGVPVPSESGNGELLVRELSLPEGVPIVGFVGRLNSPKGVESFIRMIPLVIQSCPKARFVLVGGGPMRAYLEEEAKKLGVEEHVHFLGYRKDVYPLLKQMDVVVVPSIREPFGNIVIEAGLVGKPVVASNVDGMAETIVDGETGYLIDCTEVIQARLPGTSRLPKKSRGREQSET